MKSATGKKGKIGKGKQDAIHLPPLLPAKAAPERTEPPRTLQKECHDKDWDRVPFAGDGRRVCGRLIGRLVQRRADWDYGEAHTSMWSSSHFCYSSERNPLVQGRCGDGHQGMQWEDARPSHPKGEDVHTDLWIPMPLDQMSDLATVSFGEPSVERIFCAVEVS